MSDLTTVMADADPLADREGTVFEGCITDAEMAIQRGKSLQHQRRERQLGKGPPYIQDGRKIYYHVDTVRRWLLEQQQRRPRKSRG